MKPQLLLGAGLLLAAMNAHADIYKYVDEQGVTIYTNLPPKLPNKGASKVVVDPQTPGTFGKQKIAVPSNFPRVDVETQKKRDESRRQILEEELKSEETLLGASKQALAEEKPVKPGNARYPKYAERIQGLKDEVSIHEKNIVALKKELANLK